MKSPPGRGQLSKMVQFERRLNSLSMISPTKVDHETLKHVRELNRVSPLAKNVREISEKKHFDLISAKDNKNNKF